MLARTAARRPDRSLRDHAFVPLFSDMRVRLSADKGKGRWTGSAASDDDDCSIPDLLRRISIIIGWAWVTPAAMRLLRPDAAQLRLASP